MANYEYSELELRALAAVKFFGGFEVVGSRREHLENLTNKGLVVVSPPGFGVMPASLTQLGADVLTKIYKGARLKGKEHCSAFELELLTKMGRETERLWRDAELALPSVPEKAGRSKPN